MSDDQMVTIQVDGRELKAKAGTLLIEVTDAAGINIPRFCYHKKLSIAANCRMCLVEVAKVPKPLPACATPVNEGMQVYTRSPLALAAQKGTMEFLLINHPLDCPICDQGGECELQDIALGYGNDASRFVEGKRVVPDRDIGPLIATDFTRCIHCTRCVRFGAEIAGDDPVGGGKAGYVGVLGPVVQHGDLEVVDDADLGQRHGDVPGADHDEMGRLHLHFDEDVGGAVLIPVLHVAMGAHEQRITRLLYDLGLGVTQVQVAHRRAPVIAPDQAVPPDRVRVRTVRRRHRDDRHRFPSIQRRQ